MSPSQIDAWHMAEALCLARRGEGFVEPNPMVGCVVARGAEIVGQGWHRRYGGPHAEVEALRIAGPRARGATVYVTLEPCCHHGKTPPCTEALLAAGVARVVAAQTDPFPAVAGGGLQALREAGVAVETGLMEADARRLNAPYLQLLSRGRPWVIAKWAMTLDGKLAAKSGHSQWISGEESRRCAHELRGRVDAILVGSGTVAQDDPLLTARPAGARVATRIVLSGDGAVSLDCQLVRTARQTPTLVAIGPSASQETRRQLAAAGCEVLPLGGTEPSARLHELLDELGRRRFTNVLVEGGARLLGSFFDERLIDEVRVFIAPKLAGGQQAPSPIAGAGVLSMSEAWQIDEPVWRQLGRDLYLSGRTRRESKS